ncbi:prepilin-type N-terminal cleavage/methylation domain-containing protein [Orrella sp. JC864]|uniref:prepilin-type N-terminal cleavage/methylation domain-containing protein n=1 Tax=Orrella sp. JC864 TaxID=3120298 RepID=UPI00300A7F2B
MTMPRRQQGFTLIEIMIAILIMAVISVIAWRGLESVERSDASLTEHARRDSLWMRVLQQLEQDVAQRATVELPGFAPAEIARVEAETATGPSQNETASQSQNESSRVKRDASGRVVADLTEPLLPASLHVARTPQRPFLLEIIRAAAAQPGHWQRVQWWISDGTLYRAAGPASAVFPLAEPGRADAVALLGPLRGFEVRAWRDGQGWLRLPHAGLGLYAASGLEIVLEPPPGSGAGPLRRAIPLQ